MVAPLIAARAYAAVQEAATGGAGDVESCRLRRMVGQVINQTVGDEAYAAEAQMTAQVQGKANLIDMVTAISSAQMTSPMAVRDQMIASYQQIMNMSI